MKQRIFHFRSVDVGAWNAWIEGPATFVRPFDQWIVWMGLFPVAEAFAAALGFRVPSPWEPTSQAQQVRYWRIYAAWKLAQVWARRPLLPPLGFFAWRYHPPHFGFSQRGRWVQVWRDREIPDYVWR